MRAPWAPTGRMPSMPRVPRRALRRGTVKDVGVATRRLDAANERRSIARRMIKYRETGVGGYGHFGTGRLGARLGRTTADFLTARANARVEAAEAAAKAAPTSKEAWKFTQRAHRLRIGGGFLNLSLRLFTLGRRGRGALEYEARAKTARAKNKMYARQADILDEMLLKPAKARVRQREFDLARSQWEKEKETLMETRNAEPDTPRGLASAKVLEDMQAYETLPGRMQRAAQSRRVIRSRLGAVGMDDTKVRMTRENFLQRAEASAELTGVSARVNAAQAEIERERRIAQSAQAQLDRFKKANARAAQPIEGYLRSTEAQRTAINATLADVRRQVAAERAKGPTNWNVQTLSLLTNRAQTLEQQMADLDQRVRPQKERLGKLQATMRAEEARLTERIGAYQKSAAGREARVAPQRARQAELQTELEGLATALKTAGVDTAARGLVERLVENEHALGDMQAGFIRARAELADRYTFPELGLTRERRLM